MWRVVLAGQPLSEVERWDLEDVDKYTALLDMKDDMSAAFNQYSEERSRKEQERS